MSDERDGLVLDLFEAIERHVDPWASRTREIQTWASLVATDLAERWGPRPRVVNTAAELDALPSRSVVVDAARFCWQRYGTGWLVVGDNRPVPSAELFASSSLTVVWSPPVESGETEAQPENTQRGTS